MPEVAYNPLEIAAAVYAALRAAGHDDKAKELAAMMRDPERIGELRELLADDRTTS